MAGKKGKSKAASAGPDPNAWMMTFGDLIMLLLTFFVLLLTMKSMDAGAIKERFQELANTSGPLDYSEKAAGGSIVEGRFGYKRSLVISSNEILAEVLDLLEGIEQQTAQEHHLAQLRKKIEIEEDDRGLIISIGCDELFASGSAAILPDRYGLLDAMGLLLRAALNDVIIMGHSDNRPLGGGAFESNLELSVYRALSVLFYLTEGLGLRPQRFAAGGYGDLRPHYDNADAAGRAKNRRVEFVLKKPS